MLEYFWWGSVFLLGVPVMALLLVVGPEFFRQGASALLVLSRSAEAASQWTRFAARLTRSADSTSCGPRHARSLIRAIISSDGIVNGNQGAARATRPVVFTDGSTPRRALHP